MRRLPLLPAPRSWPVRRDRAVRSVALKFAPGARFDENDEQVARMALRMLVGIRAHAQTATKEILNGMVHSMNAVLDAKDAYTAGHSERVARIAVLIGKQLGISPTHPRRSLPRRPPPRSRQDRRSRRGAVEDRQALRRGIRRGQAALVDRRDRSSARSSRSGGSAPSSGTTTNGSTARAIRTVCRARPSRYSHACSAWPMHSTR